jgi:hypothetical protein
VGWDRRAVAEDVELLAVGADAVGEENIVDIVRHETVLVADDLPCNSLRHEHVAARGDAQSRA